MMQETILMRALSKEKDEEEASLYFMEEAEPLVSPSGQATKEDGVPPGNNKNLLRPVSVATRASFPSTIHCSKLGNSSNESDTDGSNDHNDKRTGRRGQHIIMASPPNHDDDTESCSSLEYSIDNAQETGDSYPTSVTPKEEDWEWKSPVLSENYYIFYADEEPDVNRLMHCEDECDDEDDCFALFGWILNLFVDIKERKRQHRLKQYHYALARRQGGRPTEQLATALQELVNTRQQVY